MYSLRDKIVVITGGTGSWGQEFACQILKAGAAKEVRIYSRNEYKQVDMRRLFHNHPQLKFIIGDVRDRDRLNFAMRNAHVVIHLAALKHVPVVEEHLWEALQTNTIGTQNVIDSAAHNNIERVLYISSDKAVDPLNFYGITKLAGERLIAAANIDHPWTCFITYRGGNVMGSAGSVIPIFQQQIIHENRITLTDPCMTRFFISKQAVVAGALGVLSTGAGGEVFVPEMKATTLGVLADAMMKNLGNKDTKVERIRVRPGEKYSESLISRNEIDRVRKHRHAWAILPFFSTPHLEKQYARSPKAPFTEYTSDTVPHFTTTELAQLLTREGFLSRDVPSPQFPLYFKKGRWVFH